MKWTDETGTITLDLTEAEVERVTGCTSPYAEALKLAHEDRLFDQIMRYRPEEITRALYVGPWSTFELGNMRYNLGRLVWLVAHDLKLTGER